MSLQQHHSDIYPVTLTDNDWAQILQSNREAQDLLSNAIAHHEQFREDDPVKRKGVSSPSLSADIANKSSKTSELSSAQGNPEDPSNSGHDDISSDESQQPADGKPAPKKAGRKPLTTEPTNKRKAQNRAAQRAFRDRKERYVKSLEERIKELEDLNPAKGDSKLMEENMNLKVLVQKLETENYFLKEQSFTFDFPISQPGLYNVAKLNRDGLLASASSQTLTPATTATSSPPSNTTTATTTASTTTTKPFAAGNVAKPPTYDQLPWSPPSSVGDSVPNSPLDNDLSTPEQETVAQPVFRDSSAVVPRLRNGSPEELALFSQILDGSGNTTGATTTTTTSSSQPTLAQINQFAHLGVLPASTTMSGGHSSTLSMSSASPMSTLAGLSEHSPSPTLEDLVNTPLFGTQNSTLPPFTLAGPGLSVPSLTYEQTQALFTDFRDPSDPRDFFTSLEEPVDASFPDDKIDLFSDQLLDYNAFSNTSSVAPVVPSHAEGGNTMENAIGSTTHHKGLLPQLNDGEKAIPCPQAWEHIAKHPKFDDVDIDDLCAELKAKAKCSGHGPVIALSDMDKLIDRMNQE